MQSNIVNNNVKSGSLTQVYPSLNMRKANPSSVNYRLNEVSHFTVFFQNDLHIFVVYIHPSLNIERKRFFMALRFTNVIIR